jgi:hypothetical protein
MACRPETNLGSDSLTVAAADKRSSVARFARNLYVRLQLSFGVSEPHSNA